MVETERLEDIKVLKIVMDTGDKVEREWEGKSVENEISGGKWRDKTLVGHRYGL